MFKTRIGIISGALGVCFLFILGRLFQLQIVRHKQYQALASRDSADRRLKPSARARIEFRDGTVVAEDRPFFDIAIRVDRLKLQRVTLDDVKKDRQLTLKPEERKAHADAFVARLKDDPFVANLSAALKYDREDLARGVFTALDNVARKPPWATLSSVQTIARGVDEDTWLSLRSVHEDGFRNAALMFGKEAPKFKNLAEPPFPGLISVVSTRRVYPLGSRACFVIGCVNELNEQEDDQLREYGVLLESPQARAAAWVHARNALNKMPDNAAQLGEILREDPRQIDDIGRLYNLLTSLTPQERAAAARLGMAEQVKWTERPPRVKLNEAELLWLGVGLPTSASRTTLCDRLIGESGAERYYNDFMRGKHSMKFDEDSIGLALPASMQGDAEPREARPLRLTISTAWQEAAENALNSQPNRGAIVVMDARTGEILAMASNPGFDPNVFTPPRNGPQRQEQIAALLSDPNKPLLNRAIAGEYPLGSIMKAIVAAAALERGQLSVDETFVCTGSIKEGGQTFRCDGNHAHGTVNVYKGLRCSCNVMFHQVGARVGVENLGAFAKLLLGKRTGIDLPFERSGIYPDRAWRLATYPNNPQGRLWTRGSEYQLAIGQGQMSATVLQATVMMAAMGNGGQVVTPRIWLDAPAEPPVSLGVSERTLSIVRRGLDECVNVGTPGERGTCYTAFHANGDLAVRVIGKTSTAEHKKGAEPHAWFSGVVQSEKPQVAFTVMLEEAGHGGAVAGPLAYKMLREIYGTKNSPVANPGEARQE